jgi:hypothetical protein
MPRVSRNIMYLRLFGEYLFGKMCVLAVDPNNFSWIGYEHCGVVDQDVMVSPEQWHNLCTLNLRTLWCFHCVSLGALVRT